MVTYYYTSGTIEIECIAINLYKLRILNDKENKVFVLILTKTEKDRLKEVLNLV